jgi:hypothetical protein
MAKAEVAEIVSQGAQTVGYDPSEFEWETIHVEAPDQVEFTEIGDKLIGRYAGHEVIYPDPAKKPEEFFIQLRWTIPTGSVFVNAGYELRNIYTETTYDSEGRPSVTDKVALGTMTVNELKKFVDVDQNDPMKSYRVDIAKPRNADNTGA